MTERFFLFSSESERSDGSGGPDWEYIAPALAVYAVPAPVVEYIAPAPAVPGPCERDSGTGGRTTVGSGGA